MRAARTLPLVAAVAAFATIPGAVLEWTRDKPFTGANAQVHFWIVASAALAAAVASVVLSLAGARARDGRTVLLATAFSTMTALLAVHGIATPGVLAGANGVVAFAGAASLPAGAVVLALAALPALRRPQRIGRLLAAQALIAGCIVVLGISALVFPRLVPAVPETGAPAAYALLAAGLALFALIGVRAVRTWQLTRRPADLVVVVGLTWLAMSLCVQLTVPFFEWAFWIGHGMELCGLLILGVPAVLDLRRAEASRPLVGDLAPTQLVEQEEAFLGSRVRALLVRLAEKDTATEGHTRRVAMLSVQVGEQLGLARGRLRTLALGGLLHDMGKLTVPYEVLTKPGPLDDDEFAEIRKHPEAGVRLLRELGGFAPEVLRLVHDHHERLDGSGYPRGLVGEQLAIETRILAVCDVYDALVSDRVYRAAWSPERALALLQEPEQFDAACVAALEQVLAPPFVADVRRQASAPAGWGAVGSLAASPNRSRAK